MKTSTSKVISLTLGIFASAAAWGDLQAVVENCNGCHGDDGVSQWSDVPTIAGMPELMHADALFIYMDEARPCAESEYRQGDTSRPATTMCAIAADLSDEMIDELAAHYFELPFVAAAQEFNAGLALEGKAIHDEKCEKCHSDGGSNPDDEAGLLAGQWMGYLQTTFGQYASGDREQPKKMQEKMDELSAADVTALLNYYASQK
jgi:sulfide dehydrogenase cytochrome subunit